MALTQLYDLVSVSSRSRSMDFRLLVLDLSLLQRCSKFKWSTGRLWQLVGWLRYVHSLAFVPFVLLPRVVQLAVLYVSSHFSSRLALLVVPSIPPRLIIFDTVTIAMALLTVLDIF